jgi:hypothetical protein
MMKLVTPANAGVQSSGPLDSGIRRNDKLTFIANQEYI